jgi:hypothetical protein
VNKDRFQETPSVWLQGFEVAGLEISAFFLEAKSPPRSVRLRFTSQSRSGWKYLDFHPLKLLIDEELIDLGNVEFDGDVGDGYVLEYMTIDLPLDILAKMLRAKTVEGRLGLTELRAAARSAGGRTRASSAALRCVPSARPPGRGADPRGPAAA